MLVITVRLLHETVRAGSPDDTALAVGDPRGEWPPSPARLFSALVAADGTRDRCRVTDGAELRALERLEPPRIFASPIDDVVQTVLASRFVVRDGAVEGVVQEYPARTSAEVRPGVRLSPRSPEIVYLWDADLEPDHAAALAARAARIGYLGCADSPVSVTVGGDLPAVDGLEEWLPGQDAGVTLPVAHDGFVDALDAAFDEWSEGRPMRRSWIPTRRERYGVLAASESIGAGEQGTVVWLELTHRLAPRKVLTVAETLKAALLDRVASLTREGAGHGDLDGSVPWQLHGHPPPGVASPYHLARFLALPNVGHRHSDGAIHGAAIWLPPDMDPVGIEAVRDAVRGLHRLDAPGVHVGVRVRLPDSRKWSTNPRRWVGPARRWFSATPVVVERGRRRGPNREDVRAWFANAGYPEPELTAIAPVPTRPGIARLSAREVHRAGRDRYPFCWVEVEFARDVTGPVCVGRGRSLGLGLLAPDGASQGPEPEQSIR